MRCKSLLCILILMIVLCCVFGCSQKDNENQISFYYCNSKVDYTPDDSLIGFEFYNKSIDPFAYDKLLHTYLEGPQSKTLLSPFPNGTTLVSISIEQQTAYITLSDDFAKLTGIKLSIACACIGLTVKNITGCAKVVISAQNALLEQQQSITINTNEIQLTDNIRP